MKLSKPLCALILIALALLLSAVRISAQLKPGSEKHKATPAKKADAAKAQQQQPEVPLAVFQAENVAVLEALRSIQAQAKADTEEARTHDETWGSPSVRVQKYLLVVGAFYTLFAALQWKAIRRQTQIANDTLKITQRAYIHVQDLKIGSPLITGGDPRVEVRYKNSGQTPASRVWISDSMYFAQNPKEGVPLQPLIEHLNPDADLGILIGPDVERIQTIDRGDKPVVPVTWEQIEAINRRDLYWRIWIQINYTDTFGKRHGFVEVWLYNPATEDFQAWFEGSKESD